MEFSPRLVQILFLLLHSEKAITANELAKELQINKRTVFRELDHVEKQLDPYELSLKRKTGTGYRLEGSADAKERLLIHLQSSDDFDPRNREVRQKKLIKYIIQADNREKLFYYADLLQVSEATVSRDLDAAKQWFEGHNIVLHRHGGSGVSLEYGETDFRKAILSYINTYPDEWKLPEDMRQEILFTAKEADEEILDSLTESSRDNFIKYATIVVQRIQSKKDIQEVRDLDEKYKPFIDTFSDFLEEDWEIEFNLGDRHDLLVFLKACRLQYVNRENEEVYIDGKRVDTRDIIYEMANTFDSTLAYALKEDEEFVSGMAVHLSGTITRLMNHISIANPMLEEIKDSYADIYEKATKAVKVIERVCNVTVTEEEIGYLAVHFGAAMLRSEQAKRKRRVVHIGVACHGGIGISTLLSSKLKHHFGEQIQVHKMSIKHMNTDGIDFLVSTFLVESELETLRVDTMLGRESLQQIADLVEKYAFQKKVESVVEDKSSNIRQTMLVSGEIHSILNNFAFYRLDSNCTFDEALRQISSYFTQNESLQEMIYEDFTERESFSTQVIEEFSLVFLHARTKAVSESKFMIVHPQGKYFTDPYFKKTEIIIVMLIPDNDPRDSLVISEVSGWIFDDDELLALMKTRQETVVTKRLRDFLEIYLDEYLKDKYGRER